MSRSLSQPDDRAQALKAIYDGLRMALDGAYQYKLACIRLDDQAVDLAQAVPIEKPAQAVDGLMTLQDAAKFLHVSEQTVHAWRKRGIIEGLQYGEEWRFQRDELIRAGRKTQASKKPLRMVS